LYTLTEFLEARSPPDGSKSGSRYENIRSLNLGESHRRRAIELSMLEGIAARKQSAA
jgi:hypothetical protein